jgi:hypothetical protein
MPRGVFAGAGEPFGSVATNEAFSTGGGLGTKAEAAGDTRASARPETLPVGDDTHDRRQDDRGVCQPAAFALFFICSRLLRFSLTHKQLFTLRVPASERYYRLIGKKQNGASPEPCSRIDHADSIGSWLHAVLYSPRCGHDFRPCARDCRRHTPRRDSLERFVTPNLVYRPA